MKYTFDQFAGLAFVILGSGFVYESRAMSQTTYGSSIGPNVFPLGLGLILIALSLRLLYASFQQQQEGKRQGSLQTKRFGVILAATIAYALLLEILGYVICTFAFLLIGLQTMERGKWLPSLVIAGAFSIGIYYFYVTMMSGNLPGLPHWLRL